MILRCPGCCSPPRFEAYWYAQYAGAAEQFQSYVSERGLTVQEAQRDTAWTRQHPQVELYLEDPAFLDSDFLEEAAGRMIRCADGVLYAYPVPSYLYYDGICRIFSISAAAVCFFLILIPYILHLIRRITRLSQDMQVLAGGDLSHQVDSTGRDELAELGRSIEEMRRAVLEQMERENEAVLANSRLITSLSHDLRTPLTKLMGYLDILQHGKFQDEGQRAEYLKKAADKAVQMRTLSDEMFRHFQVERTFAPQEGRELVSGPVFLEQLLAEQCFDLEAAGFAVELPAVSGDYQLSLRTEDICRVFDNLFSNLKKYADPSAPIRITVEEERGRVKIQLENRAAGGSRADSRGIGIPTIQSLLARNRGYMEIRQQGDCYCTSIWLPKAEEQGAGRDG